MFPRNDEGVIRRDPWGGIKPNPGDPHVIKPTMIDGGTTMIKFEGHGGIDGGTRF